MFWKFLDLFYFIFFLFFTPDDTPNYFPNSFSGPDVRSAAIETTFHVSGDVARYNSADDDNFTQTGTFWNKVCVPVHVTENMC